MGVKAIDGKRICSGCIKPFLEKELVLVSVPESNCGPAYNTCMCSKCEKEFGYKKAN